MKTAPSKSKNGAKESNGEKVVMVGIVSMTIRNHPSNETTRKVKTDLFSGIFMKFLN